MESLKLVARHCTIGPIYLIWLLDARDLKRLLMFMFLLEDGTTYIYICNNNNHKYRYVYIYLYIYLSIYLSIYIYDIHSKNTRHTHTHICIFFYTPNHQRFVEKVGTSSHVPSWRLWWFFQAQWMSCIWGGGRSARSIAHPSKRRRDERRSIFSWLIYHTVI